jgi:hypothetical protein
MQANEIDDEDKYLALKLKHDNHVQRSFPSKSVSRADNVNR